jgi:hypothetical protein
MKKETAGVGLLKWDIARERKKRVSVCLSAYRDVGGADPGDAAGGSGQRRLVSAKPGGATWRMMGIRGDGLSGLEGNRRGGMLVIALEAETAAWNAAARRSREAGALRGATAEARANNAGVPGGALPDVGDSARPVVRPSTNDFRMASSGVSALSWSTRSPGTGAAAGDAS